MQTLQEVEMDDAEQCDGPRTTSVHSRFQVCCSLCGSVTHERSRLLAMRAANAHRAEDRDCADTYVYDRMARVGKPETWRAVKGGGWAIGEYRK